MGRTSPATQAKRNRERSKQERQQEKQEKRMRRNELKKERDDWYAAKGLDRATLPDKDKRQHEDEFLAQSPLQQAAQALLKAWEANDSEVRALWEKMNSWVYAGFDQTYADFGITFDKTYHESNGSGAGKQKILGAVEAGVLQKNPDGSIVAKLESHKLPDKVVLRADGTTLYVSNDINLAFQRLLDFPNVTDLAYVVASEQDLYFRQLFAILKMLSFPAAEHLHHVSYGMVNLPEGRMKSREGTVVDADDLLAEVITLARDGMAQRLAEENQSLDPAELERRAKIIALAAIKVYMLKAHRTSDVTFNPKESIDFAGRTGVNLLYSFARASSVLAKAGTWTPAEYAGEVSDSEWSIVQSIAQLPDAVAQAAEQYEPAILVNHLLDMAQSFNTFYHDQQILKADEPVRSSRLGLVRAFQSAMGAGLKLLNIEPLSEM
jgi:arginyl-tRNA synthetase